MAALPWICRKSLRRVLPEAVQAEIGVPDGSWAAELDRLLRTAQETLAQDVAGYADRRERAVGKRQYGLAETYERVIRNLTQRDLLGVLANRNVLPKYGFPVDTVELRITQEAGPSAGHLELTRDLSAAVHEYAPGAEIVAGGYVWTSAGVYRLPDRDLVSRWYAVCQNCGHFREDTDQLDALCPACQGPQSGAPRRYVEPVYGFVAQRAAPRRPGQSPPRPVPAPAVLERRGAHDDHRRRRRGVAHRLPVRPHPALDGRGARRDGGGLRGRNFRNQRYHDQLVRGAAFELLTALPGEVAP